MRYYKITDSTGKLLAIGTGDDGMEITEVEYHELMAEIHAKWDYIKKLADGKVSASDVPEEWRSEVEAEALYAVIDEDHAGTQADPIPYDGNMALENGKYYAQDGVVYKCTRDTGNPVYHALRDLVGLYVEVGA